MKTCLIFILLLLISPSLRAQLSSAGKSIAVDRLPVNLSVRSPSADSTTLDRSRLTIAIAGSAVVWAASYLALDKAWYADQPRSAFHFFDDSKEWLQADKGGHIWSTYQMSRLTTEMWKWTGMKKKNAVVAGAASGIAYQSIIEIQDAYSTEWGFSWSDMLANVVGASAFASQELIWNEQRIQVKLSYQSIDYPTELRERRNELFGASLAERILKEYNAHTFWLSTNLHSFTGGKLPKWLNVALGYHAEGMYGGFENRWTDRRGNVFDRTDIQRTRHWVLSPDIDFTKIPTRRKGIKALFLLMNMIKVPAPAINLSQGKLKAHFLYF